MCRDMNFLYLEKSLHLTDIYIITDYNMNTTVNTSINREKSEFHTIQISQKLNQNHQFLTK